MYTKFMKRKVIISIVFAEKIGLFNKAELLILKQAIKLMPKGRINY